MYRFHKEGWTTMITTLVIIGIIMTANFVFLTDYIWVGLLLSITLVIVILQFFRDPNRQVKVIFDQKILAPADGKVVVIEKVKDSEYMSGEWTQVSIFMSPLNVHVNRHPVSGRIKYYKYHPGKYLVAWNPKSSTENERTTIVYESKYGILKLRQIAGALARRIVCYAQVGQQVDQGDELGFIKFGSRVDLLFPPHATVLVNLNESVKGNRTIIAKWNELKK